MATSVICTGTCRLDIHVRLRKADAQQQALAERAQKAMTDRFRTGRWLWWLSSPVRDELEPGENEARHALRRQLRQRRRQRLQMAELSGADRLRRLQLADEANKGPEVGPRAEVAQPLIEIPLQNCAHGDASPNQPPISLAI